MKGRYVIDKAGEWMKGVDKEVLYFDDCIGLTTPAAQKLKSFCSYSTQKIFFLQWSLYSPTATMPKNTIKHEIKKCLSIPAEQKTIIDIDTRKERNKEGYRHIINFYSYMPQRPSAKAVEGIKEVFNDF